VPNAVASIVFPSGKLEAPAPPGSDVVTVYLSFEASEALLPFTTLAGRGRRLPAGPALPSTGEKLPSWLLRQIDGVGTKPSGRPEGGGGGGKPGAVPVPRPGVPTQAGEQLSKQLWDVGTLVWQLARFAAGGVLPELYTRIVDVTAHAHGWPDVRERVAAHGNAAAAAPAPTPVTAGDSAYFASCVEAAVCQRATVVEDGVRVLLAGDYMGGGTAEGAVRSAAWAVDALVHASAAALKRGAPLSAPVAAGDGGGPSVLETERARVIGAAGNLRRRLHGTVVAAAAAGAPAPLKDAAGPETDKEDAEDTVKDN
jgi:hypothetical protein